MIIRLKIFIGLAIIVSVMLMLLLLLKYENAAVDSFANQKHVRHVFTHKYPRGMGDFIRGSLTIAKICREKGYTFDIDYSNAGIANYMMNARQRPDIQTDPASIVEAEDKVFGFDELATVIESNINRQESGILLLGTCNPHITKPIDADIREFVRDSFLPNDTMKESIRAIKQNLLGDASTPYTLIHARIGDHVLVDNGKVGVDEYEAVRQKINAQLQQLPTKRPILVISDDVNFRNYLHDKDGYILVPTRPKHTKDDDDLKDTMIDFFMLCGASEIVQHSNYRWGSGFSDRASDLYNIPIFKTKPDDYT